MERRLYDAAAKLPETDLRFDDIKPLSLVKSVKKTLRMISSIAACFILLIAVGFVTVDAVEYRNAIRFFNEYDLSTDGLNRGEIKAVYRDITTNSFSYSKTAQVIADSVGGYEILQDNPTSEDIENLWNYKNYSGHFSPDQNTTHYTYRSEYKKDTQLGFDVHDQSFIEKFDGEKRLWSVSVSEFYIDGYNVVSDGIMIYGNTPIWATTQPSYAWMAKIDDNGNLLWKQMLDHRFKNQYIAKILENEDGSYAVISRGDFEYLCLSHFSANGKEIDFAKNEIGHYGIRNAARLGDGYVVQLYCHQANEHAKIVKVDRNGTVTDSFSYSSEDAYYFVTDMIEYNGNIYLSAYATPKAVDEGGRHEIANILKHLHDNNIIQISDEELTPIVRDNYTAMLLICDQTTGTPQEFYSVNGSLGATLTLSESGTLLWDVESITHTFYSPMTNSFTIGGTNYVFRYSFDTAGRLISQEKTGETVPYRR